MLYHYYTKFILNLIIISYPMVAVIAQTSAPKKNSMLSYFDKEVLITPYFAPIGCSQVDIRNKLNPLFQKKSSAEVKFRQAICRISRSTVDRNLEPTENEFIENKTILADIQAAQTRGLFPAKQNFAAFLEGIIHCRQAQYHYLQNEGVSIEERDMFPFCDSRQSAYGNFSDIDWGHLDFRFTNNVNEYAQKDNPHQPRPKVSSSFVQLNSQLISIFTKCYKEEQPLDDTMNLKCAEFNQVYDKLKEEIVQETVENVTVNLFKSTNPITAMLTRKLDRMKTSLSTYETRVDTLSDEGFKLESQYNSIMSPEAFPKIKAALDDAIDTYRNAFDLIFEVDDWLKRLEGGLLFSLRGENMGKYAIESTKNTSQANC